MAINFAYASSVSVPSMLISNVLPFRSAASPVLASFMVRRSLVKLTLPSNPSSALVSIWTSARSPVAAMIAPSILPRPSTIAIGRRGIETSPTGSIFNGCITPSSSNRCKSCRSTVAGVVSAP